jgi:hypothetical protein
MVQKRLLQYFLHAQSRFVQKGLAIGHCALFLKGTECMSAVPIFLFDVFVVMFFVTEIITLSESGGL